MIGDIHFSFFAVFISSNVNTATCPSERYAIPQFSWKGQNLDHSRKKAACLSLSYEMTRRNKCYLKWFES